MKYRHANDETQRLLAVLSKLRRDIHELFNDMEREHNRHGMTRAEIVDGVLQEANGNPLGTGEIAAFCGLSKSSVRSVLYRGGAESRYQRVGKDGDVKWVLNTAAEHARKDAR